MTSGGRSTGREVVRNLALWLTVAVGVALALVLAGWRPRVEYLVGLATVGALTTVALQRLGGTIVEAMWPSPFPPKPATPGVDHRIDSLETLLRRSVEDPSTYERRLRPLLEDLAAHRLRRHHGVEPTTDPEAARRLLDPETWVLLSRPTDGLVTPARLERAVAAIEQL